MPEDDPFSPLLIDEIKRLTKALPRSLKGSAPVSALLFQPTEEGGRLVYLDEEVSTDNPICLDPGMISEEFLFDEADNAPWVIANARVTEAAIKRYSENNPGPIRSRLAGQDRKRYPQTQMFTKEGIVKVGTQYKMHHVFPSPVFHRNVDWWKRLPRLGEIYSLGDNMQDPHLLLMCALAVGNRALHVRLNMLLEHPLIFREGGMADSIAASMAADEGVEDDERLFLIAHLLLCHHWFFPFDPLALKLFVKLGGGVDEILKRHGWPASGLTKNLATSTRTSDLIKELALDLAFLIYACARWDNPESQKADPDLLLQALLNELPDALALICGTVEYVSTSASKLYFHSDNFSDNCSHMCIRAPQELRTHGAREPRLPLFSLAQLSNADQPVQSVLAMADAYLRTLCPVQPGSPPEDIWKIMKVRTFQGDRASHESQKLGKWLTGYVRARCVLEIHNKGEEFAAHAGHVR